MTIERVKASPPIAIVTSSVQVYIEEHLGSTSGEYLLCTLRLRSDGNGIPQPLDSFKTRTGSTTGELIWTDNLVLPGVVLPVAVVKPKRITATMQQTFLKAILTPGQPATVAMGASFSSMWTASGSGSSVGYPLSPTSLMENCCDATHTLGSPVDEMEGMVADFNDSADLSHRFGLVVSIGTGAADGSAVRLADILNDPKLIAALGGL